MHVFLAHSQDFNNCSTNIDPVVTRIRKLVTFKPPVTKPTVAHGYHYSLATVQS